MGISGGIPTRRAAFRGRRPISSTRSSRPPQPDSDSVELTAFEERGGASPLHGRRRGKPLRPHQRELVETLLPRLAVDAAEAIDPSGLFAFRLKDLWLEIGFGGGEHLLATAAAHPHIGFIGCEPFLNGMARALVGIEADGLSNIRLHEGDAGAIIDALPAASLGRVFLLYPDPWPKRRQRKRRFVSDEMLVRLARVMKAGAELHFATDIDDYAGWTLACLLRSTDFIWTAERACDWQDPWADWASTRYEVKAKAQGRRGCYVTAVRREGPC